MTASAPAGQSKLSGAVMSGLVDRALPPSIIDLIHEGVTRADLASGGDQAVWKALRRTAMSAAARGWERWEWEPLVLGRGRRLGDQARHRGVSKTLTPVQLAKRLDSAWTAAVDFLAGQPAAMSRSELRRQGNERAVALLAAVEDPDAALSNGERAVLAHAARSLLAHNGQGRALNRVALPRERMLEQTGLGLTALRTVLRRLQERGLLTLAEPGRRRAPGARRGIANLYALPTVEHLAATVMYRETRSVVPLAQLCSAPGPPPAGAPPHLCSAPQPDPAEEPRMVTLTLPAATPDVLAAALDALRRQGVQAVAAPAQQPGPTPEPALSSAVPFPSTGRAS